MLTRRTLLLASLATAAMLAAAVVMPPAHAQPAAAAASFIDKTGQELIAVVNGPAPREQKQERLQQIIDRAVDVDAIAKFCLGRYWRSATPEQQKQYLVLFHQVLLKNISGKLGEYEGVTFVLGRSTPRDGGVAVGTVVTRPGTAPANVEWVVSDTSGSPRIVDVVAEGTSLRLTQRNDYSSYLSHNGDSVQALLDAMRQQLAQSA
jgi:phospholipid transport system substrate-binding protein